MINLNISLKSLLGQSIQVYSNWDSKELIGHILKRSDWLLPGLIIEVYRKVSKFDLINADIDHFEYLKIHKIPHYAAHSVDSSTRSLIYHWSAIAVTIPEYEKIFNFNEFEPE